MEAILKLLALMLYNIDRGNSKVAGIDVDYTLFLYKNIVYNNIERLRFGSIFLAILLP